MKKHVVCILTSQDTSDLFVKLGNWIRTNAHMAMTSVLQMLLLF